MTRIRANFNRFIQYLASGLIAVMLFVFTQERFIGVFAFEENLSLQVASAGVPVSTEVSDDGFRQITYKFDDRDIEVTDSNYTNSDPANDGEYITWMAQINGKWQIFLHHVTTGSTVQLTQAGNNVNPVISGTNVAWEGQVEGVWQVFLFDGVKTTQLTEGIEPSQYVDIDGDNVTYSQKKEDGSWKVYLYKIDVDRLVDLTADSNGNAPVIEDGRVEWKSQVGGSTLGFAYYVATDVITSADTVIDEYFELGEDTGKPSLESFDDEAFQSFVDNLGSEDAVYEEDSSQASQEALEEEELLEKQEQPATTPKEVTIEDIKEELEVGSVDGIKETMEQEVKESTQSN